MYATHRQVDDLFNDDEKRLAEFITTIAAAALENAQGFAQLKELTATLEQRLIERTDQVERQNVVLAGKQQELAGSNKELEQFAYIASHDLQEPLRKVQAFSDMLLSRYRDALGEEGADYLVRMQNATTRMKSLINELLDYSRVTRKRQPLTRVDMNENRSGRAERPRGSYPRHRRSRGSRGPAHHRRSLPVSTSPRITRRN